MTIKAGQSVTFQEGDFSNHPLESANGTLPSPIIETNSGTTVTFAFATAGTYGFECEFHPAIMYGAINVVP
jgi:plastocyanin